MRILLPHAPQNTARATPSGPLLQHHSVDAVNRCVMLTPTMDISAQLLDTTVIIPALNEEGSIGAVLAALPSVKQVVVVDNGSTDRTSEIAAAAGATVIAQPIPGYGSAVQAGIREATKNSPTAVVILDADLSDDPSRLPELIQPIFADEADFVLASRTELAEPGSLSIPQRFGNRLATTLIHLTTGHLYTDMGPFRAIRLTSLLALDMSDPNWGWNVEMQMKAVHHQLRIVEIPMPYARRHAGKSKISGTVSGVARAGVKILWAVAAHARPPPSSKS